MLDLNKFPQKGEFDFPKVGHNLTLETLQAKTKEWTKEMFIAKGLEKWLKTETSKPTTEEKK